MKKRCRSVAGKAHLLWIAAAPLAMVVPGLSFSQTSVQPISSELKEVVVTAQKREQRLTDVGITLTVVKPAELASQGITDVSQLAQVIPGLTVGQSFGGFTLLSLRGINFNPGQYSALPAVTTYVDEAPLPYAPMTQGALLDVERVEVLQGPQGTLFGQNSTGGLINVITAKPTSTFGAGGRLEVNQFGGTYFEGYVTGPLSDTLNARLAATTTQWGAWQEGYFLRPGATQGSQNKGGARLLLDWRPTDKIKVSINLNSFYNDSEPQALQLAQGHVTNPSSPWALLLLDTYPPAQNNREAEVDPGFYPRIHSPQTQAVARVDIEVSDLISLTSITNYIDNSYSDRFDGDGTALVQLQDTDYGSAKTFTQEIRLTGHSSDQKLNYIVGANYWNDDLTQGQYPQTQDNDSGAPLAIEHYKAAFTGTNTSQGIFADADYKVLRELTITAGTRYTESQQTQTGCFYDTGDGTGAVLGNLIGNTVLRGAAGLPPVNAWVPGGCLTINDLGPNPTYLPTILDVSQSAHDISWRLGLNYKPSVDSLIYALASRGFKGGTFPGEDILVASQERPVKEEELTSYEIGAKFYLLDRKLLFTGAAYHYDYVNKQFYTYIPAPIIGAVPSIVNIPESKADGVEAAVTISPISGLTIKASENYLHSRVGNYLGYDQVLNRVQFQGRPFNFSPTWTALGDAEYSLPVSDRLSAFVGFGVQYNSATYADLSEEPDTRLNSYAIFNARIGFASDKWTAQLFARNLTDKYYWVSVEPGTADEEVKLAGIPQTFGIMIAYRY